MHSQSPVGVLDSGNLYSDADSIYLTCQRHSTESTITRSFSGCARRTALARRTSTGLRRTSAAEHNKSAQRRPVRCHRQSTLGSRKVRSLDRTCFSSTLPTCCSWSNVIIYATCICRRHPDLYGHTAVRRSCSAGRSLHRRDFSVDEGKSTASAESPRPRSSGAPHLDVNTWSRVPTAYVRVDDGVTGHRCSRPWCLGYIDSDVTMIGPCTSHVTNIVRACFSALCQIWSVRRSLPQHALLTLVHCHYQAGPLQLGPCRYCCLPAKPAAVLNVAARLIFSRRASEHTTPLLRDL